MPGAKPSSDLPVRIASAVVMLAIAGVALWIGGRVLDGFIVLVALACWVELVLLVIKAARSAALRMAGILAGALYVGAAAMSLISLPGVGLLAVMAIVIATDTGAYFVGRAIGGPKIAPRISPSKTWAGLCGGMAAAAGVLLVLTWAHTGLAAAETEGAPVNRFMETSPDLLMAASIGAGLAVLAQAGDFFESWLKRKAGVKDSSHLIPGHGGVFDRVDGLLPVAIVIGLLSYR